MRKAQNVYASLLIVILFYCIFQSETVIEGAQSGLKLCFQTVIPSIFPFIFLTSLISQCCVEGFGGLRTLGRIMKIPPQLNHILISAFLCGYPVGAQSVATLQKTGQISKKNAERLLAFCNNAGPSFIFGFLGTVFPNKFIPFLLWMIHIISAVVVGIILPDQKDFFASKRSTSHENITEIVKQSLISMAIVCGWIVIFRVLISLLNQNLLAKLPPFYAVLACGILELSNGCVLLPEISNESLRFIIASLMLAAGGICVFLQTKSVAGNISLRKYVMGKSIQSVISVILASITSQFIY